MITHSCSSHRIKSKRSLVRPPLQPLGNQYSHYYQQCLRLQKLSPCTSFKNNFVMNSTSRNRFSAERKARELQSQITLRQPQIVNKLRGLMLKLKDLESKMLVSKVISYISNQKKQGTAEGLSQIGVNADKNLFYRQASSEEAPIRDIHTQEMRTSSKDADLSEEELYPSAVLQYSKVTNVDASLELRDFGASFKQQLRKQQSKFSDNCSTFECSMTNSIDVGGEAYSEQRSFLEKGEMLETAASHFYQNPISISDSLFRTVDGQMQQAPQITEAKTNSRVNGQQSHKENASEVGTVESVKCDCGLFDTLVEFVENCINHGIITPKEEEEMAGSLGQIDTQYIRAFGVLLTQKWQNQSQKLRKCNQQIESLNKLIKKLKTNSEVWKQKYQKSIESAQQCELKEKESIEATLEADRAQTVKEWELKLKSSQRTLEATCLERDLLKMKVVSLETVVGSLRANQNARLDKGTNAVRESKELLFSFGGIDKQTEQLARASGVSEQCSQVNFSREQQLVLENQVLREQCLLLHEKLTTLEIESQSGPPF